MIELLQQAQERQYVQLASEATEAVGRKRSPVRDAVQRMRSRSLDQEEEKSFDDGWYSVFNNSSLTVSECHCR